MEFVTIVCKFNIYLNLICIFDTNQINIIKFSHIIDSLHNCEWIHTWFKCQLHLKCPSKMHFINYFTYKLHFWASIR
jgi:hypothetical protein